MSDELAPEPASPGQQMPRPSSARNSLSIFGTRLFMLPLTVATGILVARILGPADRGIYTFLMLLGGFVLPILMFGFGASVTYFISSKRYAVKDVYYTCLAVGLCQGLLSALLLGALWGFDLLGETARDTSFTLILPILMILPLQGAILLLLRVAQGDSWFTMTNRIMIATALGTAVSLWVFVVIARWGVQGAAIGIVLNNLMILSSILFVSIRRYHPTLSLNRQFLHEGWHYGLKAWIADLAGHTNLRMDQWVLAMAAPPGVVGIYSPAVTISEMLWMLPDSLASVLFNKIAAARDPEEQAHLVERLNRIIFWTMALAGVALAAVGPWLVPLVYGKQFAATALPLAYLMPGAVAMSICKVLTKYFGGIGSPQHSARMAAIGALAGFVFYVVLIPLFGAEGAAIASSGCYIVTAITAIVIYRNLVAPHKPHLFRPSLGDAQWLEQQVRLIRPRQPASG